MSYDAIYSLAMDIAIANHIKVRAALASMGRTNISYHRRTLKLGIEHGTTQKLREIVDT
jgi:hypothetical protein